jgi:hypothetical protein
MHDHRLFRQLALWRELMEELVRLENPLGDLDGHRYELLRRADELSMSIASTLPADRLDVLALAELTHELAGTPVIRRASGHVILGIKTLWV